MNNQQNYNSYLERLQEYERKKQIIFHSNLSPIEKDRAIKKLSNYLRI